MPDFYPVSGTTKVVGLFAHPVQHSLSPQMQNRAFAAMQVSYVYVPWEVHPEYIGEAVAAIRALNLVGVNVTIPHKAAVIPFLDEVSAEAHVFGSVNTIANVAGRLIGHNTDAPGFLRSLKEQASLDPAGKRFFILGAGGTARPLAMQMILAGAENVTVANRTVGKAEELVAQLKTLKADTSVCALPLDTTDVPFKEAVAKSDVVINATAAGMYPRHNEPSILPPELLHKGQLVVDVVYTPRRTPLIAAAEEAGCATLPGYTMLAYQGALSIQIWTGLQPPVQLMVDTLDEALAKQEAAWSGAEVEANE